MALIKLKRIPTTKRNFFLYYTFLIFLILVQINKISNEDCSSSSKISISSTRTSCFNEIIKFQGSYRAGQFSIRNDGVLLIEYSSGKKRLFYGLNPNGRGYFNGIDIIYSKNFDRMFIGLVKYTKTSYVNIFEFQMNNINRFILENIGHDNYNLKVILKIMIHN